MSRLIAMPLVAVLALAALLPGSRAQEDGGSILGADPDETVLEVGDRKVSRAEYARYLLEKFGRRALDRFVRDLVVKEEAARRGIAVAGDEVGAWIERTARKSQEDPNFFSWLRDQGLDLEGYRTELLPAEAETQILLEKMVRADRLTEEGLRRLFEERHGVRYKARVILVREDGRLREAVAAWARKRVREARTLLEEGESFESLVQQYSESPDRDLGGDLGYFGRGRFDAAIDEAAFQLEEGGIAGPIETDFGYHLLQVTGKRGDQVRARHILVRTFRSLVRDDRAAELMDERLDPETRQDLYETAKQRAARVIDDLELGADFGTVAQQESSHWSASRSGEIPPFARGRANLPEAVTEAIYRLDEKGLSEPIRAELGYYIVRLDGTEGGGVTFEDTRDALREEAEKEEVSVSEITRLFDRLRGKVEVKPLGELAR